MRAAQLSRKTALPRVAQYLLFWAAAPAIALSVWLLSNAQAPSSVLKLQVVTAIVAMTSFVVLTRMRRLSASIDRQWIALALALSLFIPLVAGSGDGVERWMDLGGVRLYLAPVVLPVALLLLGAPVRTPAVFAASVTAAAMALVLQPDAAQLSAFALAMLVILAGSRSQPPLRLALIVVLAGCGVVVWRTPDPLTPVRYVEGVFKLAAELSPIALMAALVFSVLPIIALIWVARAKRSHGVLAAATYFASLLALAPLQVTPVPLLGYGAGPILGFFLVAGAIAREKVSDVP